MSELNELTLNVTERTEKGRKACKQLRSGGRVPAIYYGKEVNKSYSFDEREFRTLMRNSSGAASLFSLRLGEGEGELALIKELQRHPTTDAILHIDFIQVMRGQELTTKVPLVLVGDAVGVKNSGGILDVNANEIEIRCRPSQLPSSVELDVTELELGENLQVQNLPEIEGVTYVADAAQVLVSCVGSASGRAAAGEEEGDEPAGEEAAEEASDGEGSEESESSEG